MSWWRKKPDAAELYAETKARQEAAVARIRKGGPGQPCMSRMREYGGVVCETGHPAGTPHEHRSTLIGRQTWQWGSGTGNPFEGDWLRRTNREWVEAAPLKEPDADR